MSDNCFTRKYFSKKNGRSGKDWFNAFTNQWLKKISSKRTHNLASATSYYRSDYFELVTKQYQLSSIISGSHFGIAMKLASI